MIKDITSKHKKIIVTILCPLLVVVGFYIKGRNNETNPGLKVCPEEMVIGRVVGPDRSGQFLDNDSRVDTDTIAPESYYVLAGEHKTVQSFDTAWVAAHCKVPITNK